MYRRAGTSHFPLREDVELGQSRGMPCLAVLPLSQFPNSVPSHAYVFPPRSARMSCYAFRRLHALSFVFCVCPAVASLNTKTLGGPMPSTSLRHGWFLCERPPAFSCSRSPPIYAFLERLGTQAIGVLAEQTAELGSSG